MRVLERRIGSARLSLDRQLRAALLASLNMGAWDCALTCLRAHLELGDEARAEEALRDGLVGPLARGAVAEARKAALADGGTPGGPALTAAVELTLLRLRERSGPLLAALLAPGGSLNRLDVLGNVLLHELSQAIADGMPGVLGFSCLANPEQVLKAGLAWQTLGKTCSCALTVSRSISTRQ